MPNLSVLTALICCLCPCVILCSEHKGAETNQLMGSCVSLKGREVYSTVDSPEADHRHRDSLNNSAHHHKGSHRSSSQTQDSRMSRLAQAAVISPSAKHTATVIFLHGLGDTGHGWCDEFKKGAQPWIKYIFPHAPAQPVSLNAGMSMPSWFDIRGLSPDAPQDEAGIQKSSDMLKSLVEEEAKSIPSERIVIGGFSQGGAVALYTSLTNNVKLGGLLAFSTWLPLHNKIMTMAKDANKTTPILQCHGDIDHMVPYSWGKLTAEFLKSLNPAHEIKTLPGVMHSSSPEEMEEARKFIARVLGQ